MKKTITLTLGLILITSQTLMLLSNGIQYSILFGTSTPFLKRCWILLPSLLSIVIHVNGQDNLEKYVAEGLRNNEVVQQKNIALEKALLSLRIAEGMFMPSVNFQGSYTSGSGGRSISLQVGDLLKTNGEEFICVEENKEQQFMPNGDNLNENSSVSSREEFSHFRQLFLLRQTITQRGQSFGIPKIKAFADIGSEYQNLTFHNQSGYYLVGLQLDISLFAGFINWNKTQINRFDIKNYKLNYSVRSKQLDTRTQVVKNERIADYQNFRSA